MLNIFDMNFILFKFVYKLNETIKVMKHQKKYASFWIYTGDPNRPELVKSEDVEFLNKITSNGWEFEVGDEVKSTKYDWTRTIEKIIQYKDKIHVIFKTKRIRDWYGKHTSNEEVICLPIENLFLTPNW